jgi:oligopeptide transport system ATP-binding protein
MEQNSQVLLRVENLKKYFPVRRGVFSRVSGYVRAVDGISFEIQARKTLSLVGESGSGKTTAGRTIIRLMEPTDGKVYFDGIDVFALKPKELRMLRRRMQIIFQDPYGSLNPRMTVGAMVGEPLAIHKLVPRNKRRDRIVELLGLVGLEAEHMNRYPHEFSGGQRQRIGIARALAVQPDLIVADEPVSSLDVSIQAQILNLLEDLQGKLGLTYLFIAHDLSVVRHISDHVAVMYLGKIVERAPVDELFSNPLHPYTKALLSAVPVPDPTVRSQRIPLTGDIPSPIEPPPGCRFHTRCSQIMPQCSQIDPIFQQTCESHFVACHLCD